METLDEKLINSVEVRPFVCCAELYIRWTMLYGRDHDADIFPKQPWLDQDAVELLYCYCLAPKCGRVQPSFGGEVSAMFLLHCQAVIHRKYHDQPIRHATIDQSVQLTEQFSIDQTMIANGQ